MWKGIKTERKRYKYHPSLSFPAACNWHLLKLWHYGRVLPAVTLLTFRLLLISTVTLMRNALSLCDIMSLLYARNNYWHTIKLSNLTSYFQFVWKLRSFRMEADNGRCIPLFQSQFLHHLTFWTRVAVRLPVSPGKYRSKHSHGDRRARSLYISWHWHLPETLRLPGWQT